VSQKGRTPPPSSIDHAAQLRERLGRAAYEAATGSEGDSTWETANATSKELYRRVGQAVMDVIVKRDHKMGEISITSTYGYATQKPYVELSLDRSPAQFSPAKAREIALLLLESAAESEADAELIAFGRDAMGLDDRESAQLLDQFRQHRERSRGSEATSA